MEVNYVYELNFWDENHLKCSTLGWNTFKHFLEKKFCRFPIRRKGQSMGPCTAFHITL